MMKRSWSSIAFVFGKKSFLFYGSAHSFVKAAGTFRGDGRTKNNGTGLLPVADLHGKVD